MRSVAAVLRISPTTLYKYGLNRQINAAEQRQRENSFIAGAAIEQDYFKGEIRRLTEEIEKERERSKGLVGRIAIMEANAARLGFDPEEMHKPILKPVRTMSRAGQRRRWRFSQAVAYNRAAVTKKRLHRETRPVPGVHFLLHEDSRTALQPSPTCRTISKCRHHRYTRWCSRWRPTVSSSGFRGRVGRFVC